VFLDDKLLEIGMRCNGDREIYRKIVKFAVEECNVKEEQMLKAYNTEFSKEDTKEINEEINNK
jgi:hypothetical protein